MLWKMKNIIFMGLAVLTLQKVSGEAGPISEELEINMTPEQHQAREDNKFPEKCFRASGGNEAIMDVQTAKGNISRCMSTIFHNASTVQLELHDAYFAGNLSAVVEKYCNMKSDFTRCFAPFMTTLERCMENNDEKKFLQVITKFLKTISEYVCYNNGERTITLIKEGGLECLDDNGGKIQRCFFQSRSLKNMFMAANKDGFVFNQDKCTDIPNYENCIVKELSNCNTTAAVDFHNGLFKAIKRILPCDFTAQI